MVLIIIEARTSEIANLIASMRNEYIVWLEVSMPNVPPVQISNTFQNLLQNILYYSSLIFCLLEHTFFQGGNNPMLLDYFLLAFESLRELLVGKLIL